ncbi:4Fe-4S dicluster domain-containing protein [candidate division KSB1 bacterium]
MIRCNVKLCVGCRSCEVTCSSFHFNAVSPTLSRIRVAKLEETGIDMAVACLSCTEKYCLECPNDALSVGASGEILHDISLCDACELCVESCPIGAVGFYEDQPLLCDLCGGATLCVDECPTGALTYSENEEVSLADFEQAEGTPNQKRALYAEAQAVEIREGWKNGVRIDS